MQFKLRRIKELEPSIMLIGCGAHAKRIYLHALKDLESKYANVLKIVVDLEQNKDNVIYSVSKVFSNVDFCFVKQVTDSQIYQLNEDDEKKLDYYVEKYNINGVIISTDPLHHIQYALWALKNNLHILMDKPISTSNNIANSVADAERIVTDYKMLIEKYNPQKVFIVNTQRRFFNQFEIVQKKINEISNKYGIPITSFQSTHSDGQWRLPNEILDIDYHGYLGYGKISHSGYHFIDFASKLIIDSYKSAGKKFDALSVYSRCLKPSGYIQLLNQNNLSTIFKNYASVKRFSDEELTNIYKSKNEAEIDAFSIISFENKGDLLTTLTLNLVHNGFSRRATLIPNYNDLYKGNGRVRHEYHNIEQGPLQNIQIHSYQSKKDFNKNGDEDFVVGGNNHYDIYIFRNADLIGGEPLEIITAEDVEKQFKMDKNKNMNEFARHQAVFDFVSAITGKIELKNIKSNITDHYLGVVIMSMMYKSIIQGKEVNCKGRWL